MKKPLVSIITPCWNGEEYVARYFESILAQTYDCLEVIFINDGSTDRTEEIALMYGDRLKNKGYEFTYIFQENLGQAAALNAGLKIFKGDYLTWPDSDDFLSAESIEKKVKFLETYMEHGMVRSDAYLFNESNINKPIGFISGKKPNRFREDLFDDLILERDVYFAPGCYMARTESFVRANPGKYILPSRAGQNWQMLLPIAYYFRCGYIDEPLYNYVIRAQSHSRRGDGKASELTKLNAHSEILKNVISTLCLDKQHYYGLIDAKYLHKKLRLAAKYVDSELGRKSFSELKSLHEETPKDYLNYLASKNRMLSTAILGTWRLYSKAKQIVIRTL